MDNNDQIEKYAEFVAARLDAALASIESPDQRASVREALGPALALCGVSACGLPVDSPAIARAMLVCAIDMARNGIGASPDTVSASVSVPGPDAAQ